MKGKQLRFSKTFWLAFAQAIVGLAAIFLGENPSLDLAGGGLILKSVLDILVRMRTSQPIKAL